VWLSIAVSLWKINIRTVVLLTKTVDQLYSIRSLDMNRLLSQ